MASDRCSAARRAGGSKSDSAENTDAGLEKHVWTLGGGGVLTEPHWF